MIEPGERPADMTWPRFLQYRNEEEEKSKEEKEIQQAIIASLKDAEHAKMDEKDQGFIIFRLIKQLFHRKSNFK